MTSSMQYDSYQAMLEAVQAFHDKHDFKRTGGEELTYRVALMAEELGEISSCVTKGKDKQALAEEVADLFILLIGTAIAADFDLNHATGVQDGERSHTRIRISGLIRLTLHLILLQYYGHETHHSGSRWRHQ